MSTVQYIQELQKFQIFSPAVRFASELSLLYAAVIVLCLIVAYGTDWSFLMQNQIFRFWVQCIHKTLTTVQQRQTTYHVISNYSTASLSIILSGSGLHFSQSTGLLKKLYDLKYSNWGRNYPIMGIVSSNFPHTISSSHQHSNPAMMKNIQYCFFVCCNV